jgi:hypothetical protein
MKISLIIIAFIMGVIFCLTQTSGSFYESFDNNSCPNMLVRKGEKFHLINTKTLRVPGVNPVIFKNLEEYADYFKFQKSQGLACPVLYFQETYDAQNRAGYKLLANPLEPHGGLNLKKPGKTGEPVRVLLTDANRDDPPFNQNQFAGFDGQDQYIGVKTPLDEVEYVEDPMSKNWGGHETTHKAILSGKFKGRTRQPADKKPTMIQETE